jgi:hypothetical protein
MKPKKHKHLFCSRKICKAHAGFGKPKLGSTILEKLWSKGSLSKLTNPVWVYKNLNMALAHCVLEYTTKIHHTAMPCKNVDKIKFHYLPVIRIMKMGSVEYFIMLYKGYFSNLLEKLCKLFYYFLFFRIC